MKTTGKTIKYGCDINTDLIIPARYLNTSDTAELARHCMEDIDKEFPQKAAERKIIVAGENFGCGSSREHAPIAIKASGIKCVVAESFARIFYRNAINIGLPILECGEIKQVNDGDELEIDFAAGKIKNISQNTEYDTVPFPAFMQEIISCGGLMKYIGAKGEQS